MRRARNLILLMVMVFTSCIIKQKTAHHKIVMDGSSYKKAIVINATNEIHSFRDEYAWINLNYPGSKTIGQMPSKYKNKPYDVLYIVTPYRHKITLYFDVSKTYSTAE